MRRSLLGDAPIDRSMTSPNTIIRQTLMQIESPDLALCDQHLLLQPGLLATPANPLRGAMPELKEPGRDLRIDACRGIALWSIFLNHVPNNIGSWLTLRHYGFSDSAEVFMFVSGVTCAMAYGKAHSRLGWPGLISR